jgi:hypothetical protein
MVSDIRGSLSFLNETFDARDPIQHNIAALQSYVYSETRVTSWLMGILNPARTYSTICLRHFVFSPLRRTRHREPS